MQIIFHIFPLSALVAYLAATILYLRLLLAESKPHPVAARITLFFGFALHLVFLVSAYAGTKLGLPSTPPELVFSFPYTLSVVSCLLIGFFLVLERRLKITILGGFLAPLGVVFMLFSGYLFHVSRNVKEIADFGPLLGIHLLAVILGIVFLVFAFAVSLALLIQESLLKKKRFSPIQKKLPSLIFLDQLNVSLLTGGFFLMVVGVITGIVFGMTHETKVFRFDARFIWSLLTLTVYTILLGARYFRGWRGRRTAWLAVAGFGTLVASFLGVNVISGSFHVY